jgi:hypothetical protein
MSAAAIVVGANPVQTNDQKIQRFIGTLTITGTQYPVGGIPLDSVLTAALLPNTNTTVLRVTLESRTGLGYIYQRIASTGKLMILQVPPSGSLTTAAPLQELTSGTSALTSVVNDIIGFVAEYLRNS